MKLFTKKEPTLLEKEYENAIRLLRTLVPGSDEYESQLQTVERIHAMLIDDKKMKQKVSPDAIVSVAGNLFGIGAILKHEELHNITSKAMSFVMKGRVR